MTRDEEERFDEEIEIKNVREDEEERLYVSPSQHNKMLEELDRLKTKERLRVAESIAQARALGRVSQSPEYEAAVRDQAFVEGTILDLEAQLARSVTVQASSATTKTVRMGVKVWVRDVQAARNRWFVIVGNLEADPVEGRISIDSPVGRGLVGLRVGEVVHISCPHGSPLTLRVLDIENI